MGRKELNGGARLRGNREGNGMKLRKMELRYGNNDNNKDVLALIDLKISSLHK